jgi:hypothetical protein
MALRASSCRAVFAASRLSVRHARALSTDSGDPLSGRRKGAEKVYFNKSDEALLRVRWWSPQLVGARTPVQTRARSKCSRRCTSKRRLRMSLLQ